MSGANIYELAIEKYLKANREFAEKCCKLARTLDKQEFIDSPVANDLAKKIPVPRLVDLDIRFYYGVTSEALWCYIREYR